MQDQAAVHDNSNPCFGKTKGVDSQYLLRPPQYLQLNVVVLKAQSFFNNR